MNFKLGSAKSDISPNINGVIMLGYARDSQKVKGISKNIYSRCVYTERNKEFLFLVHVEIAFVTQAIFEKILSQAKKIKPEIKEKNLIITANHTHSAPGGYGKYPFYNFPNNGFCPKVFKIICNGIIQSMESAFSQIKDGEIIYKESSVDLNMDLAFNRSLKAHKNNPEIPDDTNEAQAVDRRIKVLEFKTSTSKSIAHFFGVHATSLSAKNQLIHPDNKGLAAEICEKSYPNDLFLFCQGYAGDVSPNFISSFFSNFRTHRGKFKDEMKSTLFNGELQAQTCLNAISKPQVKLGLNEMRTHFFYLNLSKLKDVKGNKTSTGSIGVNMLGGSSRDGKSMPQVLLNILCFIVKILNKFISNPDQSYEIHEKAQAPKTIMIDTHMKLLLKRKFSLLLGKIGIVNQVFENFFNQYQRKALGENTWIQETHGFHLISLGKLFVITMPFEPSVVAGLRLERNLIKKLKPHSFERILIIPYSNSYCGYLVTPEEYDVPTYERAHCIFGKYLLPCLENHLSIEIEYFLGLKNSTTNNFSPPVNFSEEEMKLRTNHQF